MTKRGILELWVGVFVAAGIVAIAMLSFKVGNLTNIDVDDAYRVKARFDNIGQLKVKAPITLAGVRIGRVSKITVDDNYFAVVTMDINPKFDQLPADSGASILTAGLLGEQYIAIEPGGDMEMLQEGSELPITQSALVLEKLISHFLYSKAGEKDDKK